MKLTMVALIGLELLWVKKNNRTRRHITADQLVMAQVRACLFRDVNDYFFRQQASVTAVGFEPTQLALVELESTYIPLDLVISQLPGT